MIQFTCTCDWVFIVGRKRVFGPMFRGPGEHSPYWHMGRMMTRAQFAEDYADCSYRFGNGMGQFVRGGRGRQPRRRRAP